MVATGILEQVLEGATIHAEKLLILTVSVAILIDGAAALATESSPLNHTAVALVASLVDVGEQAADAGAWQRMMLKARA